MVLGNKPLCHWKLQFLSDANDPEESCLDENTHFPLSG